MFYSFEIEWCNNRYQIGVDGKTIDDLEIEECILLDPDGKGAIDFTEECLSGIAYQIRDRHTGKTSWRVLRDDALEEAGLRWHEEDSAARAYAAEQRREI